MVLAKMKSLKLSKKIGMIIATDGRTSGGLEKFGNFFKKMFQQADDTLEYELIYALNTNLPLLAKLSEYRGFVISGSPLSVNDDIPMNKALTQLVLNVCEHNKVIEHTPIKIVGVCFGHQLLAKAFGEQVGYSNASQKLFFGIEKVLLDEELYCKSWFVDAFGGERRSFNIGQIHCEEVKNVPRNATRVGWSESCLNEVFLYHSGNMLSFQGHIEDTFEALQFKGNYVAEHGLCSQEEIEKGMNRNLHLDAQKLIKLSARFLVHS